MRENKHRTTLVLITLILFSGLNITPLSEGLTCKNTINSNPSLSYQLDELNVYYIDVGQGDSILIQTPENNFVLIDTGSRIYADKVISFLNNHHVTTIKTFIATHPHEDHIGGCEEIFNAFHILTVYHPGYYIDSQAYQRFLEAVENEGCTVYTDDKIDPGDYIDISSSLSCRVLNINRYASNANDAGIVLRLDYDQVSFLFTGDINGDRGDYVESYLVDYWDVDIDILKVAHHGSRHSSTDYFLKEATPRVSIISVGSDNPYGHPHQETLDRLSQYSSLIYRTDLNGDITVTTDGVTWNIYYEKPEDTPLKPIVTGPTRGTAGYSYIFYARSVDPNNDQLFYKWDFNDGNVTNWIGPYDSGEQISAIHRWDQNGTYIIRVKAKDIYDHESDWGVLNIAIPRDKKINVKKTLSIIHLPFIQVYYPMFFFES
ncbi:MAG: hypothetical protein DRN24_03845 [Thermoplasmata archaeon]|nr:MAG: hypothetical protein DRN24_03845 [Thermoplasmata archaeon]